MSKSKKPIHSCIVENESKPCRVSGCGHLRYRLASHCRKHAAHKKQWGSPQGSCWRASNINPHLEAAELFLNWNLNHPATVTALAFIGRLLDAGRSDIENGSATSLTSRTFGAMAMESIAPEQILSRLLAATLHLTVDLTERQETMMTEWRNNAGRYVMLLLDKPFAGARGHQRGKHVGSVLFGGLSRYLLGFVSHTRELAREADVFELQCKQPFRNTE